MTRLTAALLLLAAALAPAVAAAQYGGGGPIRGPPKDGARSGGVRLRASQDLYLVDSEVRGRGRQWGVPRLVSFVERVAMVVGARHPRARLGVGELSAERGGPIPGHVSHQSGRDVDFAFYTTWDRPGRPEPDELVRIDERRGRGRWRGESIHFDAAVNWSLVEAVLTDPDVEIQVILVAEHIEQRLLAEARRQGASAALVRRAQIALRQAESHPHDNHFHVRITCASEDGPRCHDESPSVAQRENGSSRRVARGRMPVRIESHYAEPTPSRGASQRSDEGEGVGIGTPAAARLLMSSPAPDHLLARVTSEAPTTLQWPVPNGRYGRGVGFTRRDNPEIEHRGIDILAPPGSPIVAVADGLVVYAGSDAYETFGNVVFILHANGWVTIYAHCQQNLVQAGEMVYRGEVIALVGDSGLARGPHLHFELRAGGEVYDPESLFEGNGPRSVASAGSSW